MKEITLQESAELIQSLTRLAKGISEHYANAEYKANSAKGMANEAIKDALLCGKMLTEAKALVPHGRWLKWLHDNCEGISHDTASRYMRLSNIAHVRNLEGAGITQAYIACGILPPPEAPAEQPERPATVEDLIRFAGFASRITPESFSGMVLEQGQREKLRERLKPAHEAYLALEGN